MRTADELLESGLAVLDSAYCMGAYQMRPLFSGGHDSLCACHLASQHRGWRGDVYHIDTGIGAKYTREFVERVCNLFAWDLKIFKSKVSYEDQIREYGFPGPGAHGKTYNHLKDRCVVRICRGCKAYRNAAMLVNGARSQESVRRMGHVAAIQVGEVIKGKGAGFDKYGKPKRCNKNRVWTAPCHDWSKAEQQLYMDEWGLPINKLKVALGMSGECFCGAFAAPGELENIRRYAPDVGAEIDRLTQIATACGKPCEWGKRPSGKIAIAETGPMCSACDQRMASAGIQIT